MVQNIRLLLFPFIRRLLPIGFRCRGCYCYWRWQGQEIFRLKIGSFGWPSDKVRNKRCFLYSFDCLKFKDIIRTQCHPSPRRRIKHQYEFTRMVGKSECRLARLPSALIVSPWRNACCNFCPAMIIFLYSSHQFRVFVFSPWIPV